jgi:hypothetical protein
MEQKPNGHSLLRQGSSEQLVRSVPAQMIADDESPPPATGPQPRVPYGPVDDAFRRRSVHADLSGADLTNAILIDANLTGAVLDGAKLEDAILPADMDDD